MDAPTPRTPQRALAWTGIIVVAACAIVALTAASRRGPTHAQHAMFLSAGAGSSLEGRLVRIDVEGMSCPGCAKSVESELRKVAGVTACRVNLESHVAEVRLAGADVPREQLLAAVEDAGYDARLEPEPPATP